MTEASSTYFDCKSESCELCRLTEGARKCLDFFAPSDGWTELSKHQ